MSWRAAVLLLALGSSACRRETSAPVAAPTPNPYPSTWRFHNEEEWLVAQTVEAIAGIALFASGRSAPAPLVVSVTRSPLADSLAPRRFTVRLSPGVFDVNEIDLPISDHIWSPDAYAGVARKLPGGQTPARRPASPITDFPAALLDLRIETLERENRRLSSALAGSPLDPALNQDAALLLGAFGLRESGWFFGDARVPLCRLAAHLAIARLGDDGTVAGVGRLAETALDVLSLRQKAAVERLATFAPGSRSEEAWARALRLAATGDWRQLAQPENASLLERFVYLRTVNERLDLNSGLGFVDRAGRERVTDWRRLMLDGYSCVTVESCNKYGGRGLAEDEAEVLAVWRAHRGANLEAEDWVDALGMNPAASPAVVEQGRAETFHVIDLGLWMAFERRQVMNQIRWDDRCLTGALALREAGRAQRKAAAHDYGRLETYPLIAGEHVVDPTSYQVAMKAASGLVRARPDLVSANEWVQLTIPTPYGSPAKDLAPYSLWFDPSSPFGTAFDARARQGTNNFRPLRNSDFRVVSTAQADIAPYQYVLRWRLCQSRVGPTSKPGFEVIEPVYREIAEYDTWALEALAWAANKASRPEDYRRYVSRRCDLTADTCAEFADWLVKRGESEEAAKVYRSWISGARDRVRVSNGVDWLVNYDYDHGRKDEALRIAREAAEVYSANGLQTLGRLLEQTGDLAGAERSFRNLFDRYDTTSQFLIGFYRRHANDSVLRPRVKKLEQEVFPDGLEHSKGAETPSPPVDGVFIAGSSTPVADAGLQAGNIIVALDGYRVRNLKQYNWVRFLAPDDAPMNLTVWAEGHMKDVHANPKDRWFYADFENYVPGTP